MTEKQIEKMKKYVELIANCAFDTGAYWESDDWDNYKRYGDVLRCIILRMEREMKR